MSTISPASRREPSSGSRGTVQVVLDPSVQHAIGRAERFIATARLALEHGDPESAVSRVYYALYHMTILLLGVTRGITRGRWDHNELHRMFLDQFCKLSFKFNVDDGEDWGRVRDARIDGDYGRHVVTTRRAQRSIERAQRLISKIRSEVGADA